MNTFSDSDLDAAETIIGALDSRLRVQIIWRLSIRDHFVHELVGGLGKSQPLISQHLRVLKRSGIVDSERRGREVIYRLVLPQAAELIDAAVQLGLIARGQQAVPRHGAGAEGAESVEESDSPRSEKSSVSNVVDFKFKDELRSDRGQGTEEDPVGSLAHTPAAAVGAATETDTIPAPAPFPPTPHSFR